MRKVIIIDNNRVGLFDLVRMEAENISKAMEQAVRDSKVSDRQAFPTVFHKKSREELLVTMRFKDWIQLYREYYSSMKLEENQ